MTDPRITRIAARTQALADAETVIGVLLGKTLAEFRAMTPEARKAEATDLRGKARGGKR